MTTILLIFALSIPTTFKSTHNGGIVEAVDTSAQDPQI